MVGDAVVDGLELLVDEEGQHVATPHLAVEDLAHRGEGRVGDARQLHQVLQHQVEVLEGLAQQREPRLGAGLAEQLLHVGVDHVVLLEVALDVLVEAGLVDLLLAQDGGAEVDDAQQRVVHQAQLLRPVAQRQLLGLLLGEGLVLDAEEALEAAQPHLELEQVAGLPRRAHLIEPLPHLAAEELGPRLGAVLGARLPRAHSARALYAPPGA